MELNEIKEVSLLLMCIHGGFPNILIGTSQLFPDKAFFITGDMLID